MPVSNYELGPAKIEFKGEDLGKTSGGVTVTTEETFAPLNTDQDGENPVDEHKTGTTVSIDGSLAEITLDQVARVFKENKVTSGDQAKVEIGTGVGTSMLDKSDAMVLKPYDGGTVSGNANDYLTIHHAGMKATGSLAYNSSDQRALTFTVTGYPDTATGIIATWGDTSV